MNELPFVGRESELTQLNGLLQKKTAQLVVMKGRRRIGKSRLIEEFAKGKKYYSFTGLPPMDHVSAQDQRDEFAKRLYQYGLPNVKAEDWTDLFILLAQKVKRGRVIILIDEISWMSAKDPLFLVKLKNAWEFHFKKNPQLILILCGSVSSWIEKNIISNTGFFGRITANITLDELPLLDSNKLLAALGFKRSAFEVFHILAITGGVPWYIEQINGNISAIENIKALYFQKNGLLVDEFKRIFDDLFGRRGEVCKKIIESLANGAKEHNEIAKTINYHHSGALSEYLNDLVLAGFISRDFTWLIKAGKESKLSQYRLSDNYCRFYLKFIAPHLNKINNNHYSKIPLPTFPGWNAVMGLQFENLILKNRALIQKQLGITPAEIVADNPYFQRANSKQSGCQIDYLIQNTQNTIFVCEIKFSQHEIKPAIIEEVKQKLASLKLPKSYSCLPVLIHVNGVHEHVEESGYFYKIIDFGDLLIAST